MPSSGSSKTSAWAFPSTGVNWSEAKTLAPYGCEAPFTPDTQRLARKIRKYTIDLEQSLSFAGQSFASVTPVYRDVIVPHRTIAATRSGFYRALTEKADIARSTAESIATKLERKHMKRKERLLRRKTADSSAECKKDDWPLVSR